jgi:hypothetical protein
MVSPRMPISLPNTAEACRGMFSWAVAPQVISVPPEDNRDMRWPAIVSPTVA